MTGCCILNDYYGPCSLVGSPFLTDVFNSTMLFHTSNNPVEMIFCVLTLFHRKLRLTVIE